MTNTSTEENRAVSPSKQSTSTQQEKSLYKSVNTLFFTKQLLRATCSDKPGNFYQRSFGLEDTLPLHFSNKESSERIAIQPDAASRQGILTNKMGPPLAAPPYDQESSSSGFEFDQTAQIELRHVPGESAHRVRFDEPWNPLSVGRADPYIGNTDALMREAQSDSGYATRSRATRSVISMDTAQDGEPNRGSRA